LAVKAYGEAEFWLSGHSDEGEKEQGEDQNDLSAGQPEFGFTISFDSQDVKEATPESAGCFILLILV
jgi:hypothetical protein